jgi:predicted RNA polymerase sigma factor
VLEYVFRDEWGRVLASLVGFLGDFDKAEEAAQEPVPQLGHPIQPARQVLVAPSGGQVDRATNCWPGMHQPTRTELKIRRVKLRRFSSTRNVWS